MEGDQIDRRDRLAAVRARHRLPYDSLVLPGQLGETLDDQAGVDGEQLHGIRDELLLGQEAVPLVGRLGEGVLKARLDPIGAVVRNADGLGDAVRGEEADPPDVRRQAVRLVPDDRDGGVRVLLVDPHGDGGGDADALEEDHDLLDGLLLLPGGGDALRPLGAEAGHLDESLGLVLDDVERVEAEVLDYPVGEHRADALDQTGAQIAADALDGGREDRRVVVHRELLAVLRVRGPAALHTQ